MPRPRSQRRLNIGRDSDMTKAIPTRQGCFLDGFSLCGFVEAIETDLANDDEQLLSILVKLRELCRLHYQRNASVIADRVDPGPKA